MTTMAPPQEPQDVPPDGWPDGRMVKRILFLLTAVYVVSFVDRQILSILAEPIRKELGLSDSQIGLMTGLAFALLYTVGGIPLARYADRRSTNRVTLMTICLAGWSLTTALCGSAHSFMQLALLRVGVGIGEAGCTPAAHSLISDLVPPERRASAMSRYGLGQPIGSLLGLVAGGLLANMVGWRAAFWIVGIPGILLAVLLKLMVKEPRLLSPADPARSAGSDGGFVHAFRRIVASRTYVLMLLAGALITFFSYGTTVWNGILLQRHFGLSTGTAGVALGLVAGLAGGLGTLLGGRVSEAAGRRGVQHQLTPIAIGLAVSAPVLLIGYNAVDWRITVAALMLPQFCVGLSYGPSWALAQTLVPPDTRATASAMKLFVQSLFGIGFGPLAIGVASDLLKPAFGTDSIRWALNGASLLLLVAACIYFLAARRLPVELASVHRLEPTGP